MEKKRKKTNAKVGFMQGVVSLMASQILVKLLGLVYTMYLTNKENYGDVGNGISAGAYNLYALLLTISSIGVPSAISKIIAERVTLGDKKGVNRIFRIALLTFGLLGAIGSLILFCGARVIADKYLSIPESFDTLIALSPSVFIVSIASVYRGYFNGLERLNITAKSQSLEQIYKCIFTLVIVEVVGIYTHLNTTLMAAGANLATTLSTLMGFLYLKHYFNLNKKIEKELNEKELNKKELNENVVTYEKVTEKTKQKGVSYANKSFWFILKKIFIVSIPITLTAIMSSINKNIDSVTVVSNLKTFLSETEATKLFGILNWKVDTLTNMPLALNVAFSTALVPAIATAKAKNDKESIKTKSSTLLLYSMLIGLPCTIGMMVLASPILHLLFPAQPDGTFLLQLSAIAIIFTVLRQNLNAILQGYGKLYIPIIALGVGLVVKYIINVTLIPNPQFGINGAAIGSVVCQIIAFVISFVSVRKYIKLNLKFTTFIVKPLIASTLMGLVAHYVYVYANMFLGNAISTIISLLFAVIVYIILVVGLRILSKEQIYSLPKGEWIYSQLEKLKLY